ncbi:MAG: hypothetical protein Q9M14_05075 [Mariprofundaceae bacterium]|nr:hypothetical protein [Mariprofundaceae bacterium]
MTVSLFMNHYGRSSVKEGAFLGIAKSHRINQDLPWVDYRLQTVMHHSYLNYRF